MSNKVFDSVGKFLFWLYNIIIPSLKLEIKFLHIRRKYPKISHCVFFNLKKIEKKINNFKSEKEIKS